MSCHDEPPSAFLHPAAARRTRDQVLGRPRRTTGQVIPLAVAMISPDRDTQAALADGPHRNPGQDLARAQMHRLMEARIDPLPEVCRTVVMPGALPTDGEPVAFACAETVTQVSHGGVSDAPCAGALTQVSEAESVKPTVARTLIKRWNRLRLSFHAHPAHPLAG